MTTHDPGATDRALPEPAGVGSMLTLAVERLIEPVEGMHRAIVAPWLAAAGHRARRVHDAMTGFVYGAVRLGAGVVGVGLDTRATPGSPSVDAVRALVNGLWGDDLGRHAPRVGTPMSIRNRRGESVRPGPDLLTAFPNATDRLVVLVHGLVATERCWYGTVARPGMHPSIADHSDLTPVAIRYNTGLPVAANGAELASIIEELHAAWPRPLRSIALVGHSMGGLVALSACAAARSASHGWIRAVTDVITIGSPHRGAPLEKLVDAAARGLGVAPQTRPLAGFLEARSRGIKDLRAGFLGSGPGGVPDPAAGTYRHHFVAGVVTASPTHPIGVVVGDLMVRTASSTRPPAIEPTNVVVLGGVGHFDLLHEPAVIDHVMTWLEPPG